MIYGKVIAFVLGLSLVFGAFYVLASYDGDVVSDVKFTDEMFIDDMDPVNSKPGTGEYQLSSGTYFDKDSSILLLNGTVDYAVINDALKATGSERSDVVKVIARPGTVIKDYKDEDISRGTFENMISATMIDLRNADTSGMRDMSNMFRYCESLKILNLDGLDTGRVTSMESMFRDCTKLSRLDLASFDTSKVQDMESMFRSMAGLKDVYLGSGFDTSRVKDMSSMFKDCINITSLDLSMLRMSSVTTANNMFDNCSKLSYVKFGTNIGSTALCDMSSMFYKCGNLASIDLSGFNTSKVSDMSSMFEGCCSLSVVNITGFESVKLSDVSRMFAGCSGIRKIISGTRFDLSAVRYSELMFSDCLNLNGGNGTTYDYIHLDKVFAHADGGTSNPGYFMLENNK